MAEWLRIRILTGIEIIGVRENLFPVRHPAHACRDAGGPFRNAIRVDKERGRKRGEDETDNKRGHKSANAARCVGRYIHAAGVVPLVQSDRDDEETREDEEQVDADDAAGDEIRRKVVHHRASDDVEAAHAIESRHMGDTRRFRRDVGKGSVGDGDTNGGGDWVGAVVCAVGWVGVDRRCHGHPLRTRTCGRQSATHPRKIYVR